MIRTIAITMVGPLNATTLQLAVRNDLARRHDAATRVVPVDFARQIDPGRLEAAGAGAPASETLRVNLLV
ncbi:hypothetical protein OPKNFCMD_0761 [Methylobacterium crusticola]|uniref:Uncharacterized protein n=1 Tax=Methylobacterium crusticola TaxID=1697972 RepID=A0ABQ4QRU1_9HYPH|nr:hypothetical protein [Methylobacterium crusticola]GJD48046.1 hypothetical protein OPKNFCMD_0761 [Methylobacterium crusticola]